MHHARQFCTECRGAYNQAMKTEANQLRQYTGKTIDRRRHHSATIGQRVRTAQRQGSIPAALVAEAAEYLATDTVALSVQGVQASDRAARNIAQDTMASMALLGRRGWPDAQRTASVVVNAALRATVEHTGNRPPASP